ncbi:PUA-like domain-containing protein [Parachaetomium inaequale]|uniref:PUA-like domain-containing protein n=1 Tax=Parachaetomium inaequale TaxID=2588326 RepID=A0AAN6SQQ4_9PEZI|nr:PUA-like domain-containing protein [Parachaetomium inaequale]
MSAIDPSRPDIVAFMAGASSALGCTLPPPKDVFNFGGPSPALADERLLLAVQGKKTATTSWPVPDPLYWGVGDMSVILDGKGAPTALMRTTSLVQCRFRDVDEEFALAEAEGDYEAYRTGHVTFYRLQENGEAFGDESVVLCERFEVIYSVLGEQQDVRPVGIADSDQCHE